ncbi:FAD-dependent oxidoreductase [Sphingobium estronivorans]|uniref:FAD-dependent oxidoreductase n=1 Tax=Sphingobium estronivorans TaxID=1577690 RepID=UPI001F07BC83|nr:FAD-dependent oxidoreductase [Sphingobium estronivorans]
MINKVDEDDAHMVSAASDWDVVTDVLVVGTGAGGLTAAIVAADQRLRVMLIEKSDQFGGTSATSGGVVWIPASRAAQEAGHSDSADEGLAYIKALAGDEVADARMRAFVAAGPEMLDYLGRTTEVRYVPIPYPDYHAELPGGKMGWRSLEPLTLDGRRLGADLKRMRPTHPAGMLFGKMAWTAAEAAPLITRSKGWIAMLAKVILRYYGDIPQRLRSPRNRFLTTGTALIGRLKLSLDQRGVAIHYRSRLIDLVRDGQRVIGAEIEQDGKRLRVRAERSVILASGGFERDPALRAHHLPSSPNPEWSGAQENNVGDGLMAATRIGAATERLDSAWWTPTIKVPGEDRARPVIYERSLPGSIIVNRHGRRVTNESASYHVAAGDMQASVRGEGGQGGFHILFDATFRKKYPMGPVIPFVPDSFFSKGVRSILVKTRDWDRLAARIGVPADALKATVERFNQDAVRGVDSEFGRGGNGYDRLFGDPRVTPNPNLAPLLKAPFYAMPINPGDLGTNGGLSVDEHARVLDTAGYPIEGLYAIGNCAASVMGRSYPGAGATLGQAMTFGYVAARHSAGRHQADEAIDPALHAARA